MIVTHTAPDLDAVCSVWLLKNYGDMQDHEVVYVNTGAPDPSILEAAAAVVDTGREYDVTRWRFDHHQFPGKGANATCAAALVWDWLIARAPIPSTRFDVLMSIEPLVRLVQQADTGGNEWGANWSRSVGLHALFSSEKVRLRSLPADVSDPALYQYGADLLDRLAEHLYLQSRARATLREHTVYCSDDGLVRALRDAPQGATYAAHEEGARLVVFADYTRNAIGVVRGGEGQDVHCGRLVDAICADTIVGPRDEAIVSELLTWYRHESGFFAGRGTAKAPREDAIIVDVADVARALDRSWQRDPTDHPAWPVQMADRQSV